MEHVVSLPCSQNQINTTHAVLTCFFNIHFNIILSPGRTSAELFLSSNVNQLYFCV